MFTRYPEYLVVVAFAVYMLIFGIYTTSPANVSPEGMFFGGAVEQIVLGSFYASIGLFNLITMFMGRNTWIKFSTFGLFLAYLFAAVFRITGFGLNPIGWLLYLLIAVVMAFCRICMDRHDRGL